MDDEPQRVAGQGANRDGLAAVAVVVLAALLIAFLISQIV
jgi:hypothetical protein